VKCTVLSSFGAVRILVVTLALQSHRPYLRGRYPRARPSWFHRRRSIHVNGRSKIKTLRTGIPLPTELEQIVVEKLVCDKRNIKPNNNVASLRPEIPPHCDKQTGQDKMDSNKNISGTIPVASQSTVTSRRGFLICAPRYQWKPKPSRKSNT
jgi:hypothetical protein